VQHGCPLAPYLFLIVGEVLNFCAKKEAAKGWIKGIQLPDSLASQIIVQFVDDTSMTIKGEEELVQNTVSTLVLFCSGSGLMLNVEKSTAYWPEPGGGPRPEWTERVGFQWATAQDVSTLLGTPFELSISSEEVDNFLLDRMDKKLSYWAGCKLNLTRQTVIGNTVLLLAMLYFLAIWGRTGNGGKRIKAKVRIYLWVGEDKPCRA
jgi:hypothetical protein